VARACHANALALAEELAAIPGVERAFAGPSFHEFVLRLKAPAGEVLKSLEAQGILGGLDLAPHYPELGSALLVCATETKTREDIGRYRENLARIVGRVFPAAPGASRPAT
jgi:glycine dehydrogenase subunit 1